MQVKSLKPVNMQNLLSKIILIILLLVSCNQDIITTQESVKLINDCVNVQVIVDNIVANYQDTIILNIEPKDTISIDGEIKCNNYTVYKGILQFPYSRQLNMSNSLDSLNNKLLYPMEFDATVKDW